MKREPVARDVKVLTADLCKAEYGHEKCLSVVAADPEKHEITEAQRGETIFCICDFHRKPGTA